jgi:hypothetical protein
MPRNTELPSCAAEQKVGAFSTWLLRKNNDVCENSHQRELMRAHFTRENFSSGEPWGAVLKLQSRTEVPCRFCSEKQLRSRTCRAVCRAEPRVGTGRAVWKSSLASIGKLMSTEGFTSMSQGEHGRGHEHGNAKQ